MKYGSGQVTHMNASRLNDSTVSIRILALSLSFSFFLSLSLSLPLSLSLFLSLSYMHTHSPVERYARRSICVKCGFRLEAFVLKFHYHRISLLRNRQSNKVLKVKAEVNE